jgi:uncharacterized protein YdiU (UPF0061 family)
VLNSDNIAITCESFDYGPWRWTPYWDGGFTAAYFDHAGLYSFARQPEAIYWDLGQLAGSLRTIAEVDTLTPALEAFPARFQEELATAICRRLGVKQRGLEQDSELLVAIETALAEKTVTIDRFFFDWRGGSLRRASGLYDAEHFAGFTERVAAYEPAASLDHEYWSDLEPCSMHIEEVEAIWSGIDEADDWSALNDKVASVRRMGEAMAGA